MSSVVEDVIAFCRMFSSFEREEICCGTVSPAQCVLLQTLRGGEWDVSTLASHARVTKGAMTRLVDGLEKRDWVTRTKGEHDARRVLVSLTPAGKKEAKRLHRLTSQKEASPQSSTASPNPTALRSSAASTSSAPQPSKPAPN
jgi:DNA-binding MarR family transcriptional regulator